MRHWYSPRGARRGLLLAGIAAALWAYWAVGFIQGAAKAPAPASASKTNSPVNVQCCVQRRDVRGITI